MPSVHPQDAQIRALHAAFLDGWNSRSGASIAACFADDGDLVGYDGTHTSGRLAIASELRRTFGDHPTATYVGLVRSVRALAPGVAVLSAHAGVVPPGEEDVEPSLHCLQTLVAVDEGRGRWKIGLLQITPAALAGRPDVRDALTQELRGLLAVR